MEVNILITGGCGFIGGHLVKKLISEREKITVLDIFLDPRSIFARENLKKRVNLQFIDIRDREKVLKIFKKIKPSFVFHLAAQSLVEDAFVNPYETFDTNIMGTVNILDAVKLTGNTKGVIVASSDKAYGKTNKAYKETDCLKGDHPYDVSKSCEDLIAQTYFKTYNLPVVITRFGNVYGEGDFHSGRIIPDICQAIIENEILKIRSNGSYIRDYIYVKDVIEAYSFLFKNMQKVKGEAFNFSSKDNLSVIDLVKRIEKILGIKIPYKILNTAKNEIPYQHLNDTKIRHLGWKSTFKINSTMLKILNWYKAVTPQLKGMI